MSDSRSSSPLPERPSLDQLRKQAKELRATQNHATLASAQLALARRYGFASWPKLKLGVALTQLRAAIDDGDVPRVRTMLEASPALAGATFADGSTPLHAAAEANRADIVELLVRHGASLGARFGKSSHSALSWALTCEALDAARKLVEMGSEPDLFCAAGLGDLNRVKAFWNDGTLRPSPSKTGSSRTTESGEALPRPPKRDADQVSDALYLACRLGALETSRWLLDHGADPNWRGYEGATPLAWAEFSGNADVCALLRERGASDDVIDYVYRTPPRAFPVMVFANWGFGKRLAARLEKDRTLVHTRGGIGTPLHAAAAEGRTACVRILLRFGADASATDDEGRTAEDIARQRGHEQLAGLLRPA